MKRVAYVLFLALLCGCAPTLVTTSKVTAYRETISKLAVLVAEPSEMKSTGGSGAYASYAGTKAGSAVSALNDALRSRLAPYFSANGIKSESIAASDKSSDQYSHRLAIVASSGSATCYYSKCQAKVLLGVTLQDLRSEAIIWQGTLDVPETSSFDKMDAKKADEVGALILRTLRSENFVSVR
ncbi:MAG: hypothetical protein HYX47_10105 [Burkholderiales bacterium]|nr:hypothetical protein [Burkholderiales bacterium]